MIMGIFTSSKRSLQDLPKPASFEFGSVKSFNLPEINEESSVSQINLNQRDDSKTKKQVFVKMEHYKEALETIDKIREKIENHGFEIRDTGDTFVIFKR